jgi:hypothetical protein
MKRKYRIKEKLRFFVDIIFILFLIFCFFGGLYQFDKESKEKEVETQVFIENCVKNGGKIDFQGNFFNKYLICYPKME